jgi:hypothetical protein
MSYFVPGAHPLSYAFAKFTLLIVWDMSADRIEPLAHGFLVLNILWNFVDCETNTRTTLITYIYDHVPFNDALLYSRTLEH